MERSENHQPTGRAQGWDSIELGDELRYHEAARRKRIRVKLRETIVRVLALLLWLSRVERCLAEDDERRGLCYPIDLAERFADQGIGDMLKHRPCDHGIEAVVRKWEFRGASHRERYFRIELLRFSYGPGVDVHRGVPLKVLANVWRQATEATANFQ
jgi:hypothetical protein